MSFPSVTYADWRAQVEKELSGAPFEKALVQRSLEGLALAPLYTELPAGPLPRDPAASAFRICLRDDVPGDPNEASWVSLEPGRSPFDARRGFLVLDGELDVAALATFPAGAPFALGVDPLSRRARGEAPHGTLAADLAAMAVLGREVSARFPGCSAVTVSTLAYHDAGADAADELSIALSTGVAYLRALVAGGLSVEAAADQIVFRVAVGRDTFGELAKLRALRGAWQKVLVAAGLVAPRRAQVHAVASARTLAVRDPWVNMLRVTTQVFAAILGGADLVTPLPFDHTSGPASALGARVARNTGLVLREESFLGKVADPAGGSYYLEALTDALSREAWARFRALEAEGGAGAALAGGALVARIEATWRARLEAIAKRKMPILGVSEFANLGETLPAPLPAPPAPPREGALCPRRDAEAFEALRARLEAREPKLTAVLLTLGPLAESRARVGFAAGFFAAGGVSSRETQADERAELVCLCGADERYAEEAVARVRALKALGCERVLLAGRPGALEGALREAGVSGFIHVGCDVLAILSELGADRAEGTR